ncbi:MAG: hypothetical protein K8S55_13870 [Phycisphaerae bacterium]|nr:hypothetical protein [Phycisphaerae bacterium]
MTVQMVISPMVILVAFFLVLLVKWSYVLRPKFFLLGCAAIVLSILFTGIFSPIDEEWADGLLKVLNMIFTIVAFGCAFLACYNAKLPKNIPGTEIESDSEETQVEEEKEE